MSEMVERVKEAIRRYVKEMPLPNPFDGDEIETHRTGLARAAIAAMREPTASMVRAGFDCDENEDCGQLAWGIDAPPHIWRAMIDAALAE